MSLELNNVNYIYSKGFPDERHALKDINIKIGDNEFIAIIGHTGSGKSTLIQHFNGLEKPTSGTVLYNGEDIFAEKYNKRALRCEVGLVFQYPEHQLFELDVISDVMFGPKNQGKSDEEARKIAIEALELLEFPKELYEKAPFELSGGQKRRVAIAGVMAMNPKLLILDEPTAGLDPVGRDNIYNVLNKIWQEKNITVIVVSHSMEDVARYAKRLIVLNDGEIKYDASPREVFSNYMELEKMGLAAPQVTYLMSELRANKINVSSEVTTIEEALEELLKND